MFNTKLPLYGICIIIAIVSGLALIYKNAKLIKLKNIETVGLILYIALGAIFGAKYFSFFINPEAYNNTFEFTKIGLSSYGAVIGIGLMSLLFSVQYKKKINDLMYIFLPSLPLMYGIGKIGCFLSGCCYGIKYSGIFSVKYYYSYSAPQGISLFPVQLIEAIVFIFIFIFLQSKIKTARNKTTLIGATLIICGTSKFLLDFLRMNQISLFTPNKIISLIFITLGITILLRERIKLK